MRNENSECAADCVLYNAKVITLDLLQASADFLAIKGNNIIGVGRRGELDQFKKRDTKRIDCEGGAVIPAFNDAHCHPLSLGATMVYVDCSKDAVRDIDDIKEQIRKRAEKTEPGKWIRVANYDEVDFSDRRAPNRWELDEAALENPVILIHRYGQPCFLNSMALQIAGFDRQTKDSSTGTIHRESETKMLNGMISGRNEQVERTIPSLDDNELEEGMKSANNAYLSFGIKSLQDMSWTNGLYH
ncbi:MAG: amidohydrolase family protein [Thermodesulfobacteriota bacterium]|nr:amidohydrolase family protein [Thermodesulfobacteriota bacterium]